MYKFARSVSVLVVPAVFAVSASAQAANPVDANAALSSLSGSITGFGPVLFGLALAATVIMIGVAWIKKGRSAAR